MSACVREPGKDGKQMVADAVEGGAAFAGECSFGECIDIRHTSWYTLIVGKSFEWDEEKNHKLFKERGISFEAIVSYIESGAVVAIVPGLGKFKHQKQFLVAVNNYIHIVPFVEEENRIFLKTIIPSRKMTKRYLSGGI